MEFAVWLVALAYPFVNAADLAVYAFRKVEVQNAAQMAVQAAFNTCGQNFSTPVYTSCNTVNSNAGANAVTAAVKTTTLGSRVSVSDVSEYVDGSKQSGSLTNPPSASGDYLGVKVTFSYTPLFGLATVASLLGTTITQTYWMRMSA